MLGNIDDDGYLRRKLESIVDDVAFALNIKTDEIELIGYDSVRDGDAIVLNGKSYEYRVINPDCTPGSNISATVANIVQKLQDSTDLHHYRMVYPSVDPTNNHRIMITSLITGDISNQFPIGVVDALPTTNFSVTPMSGGISLSLGDPAYPAPPTLGDFLDPNGALELLTVAGARTSASFLMRIPEGMVGMNAYGEVAVWVEVLDSRFSLEIGRSVLFAIGHFPIQAKTDRHIYTQRIVVNF